MYQAGLSKRGASVMETDIVKPCLMIESHLTDRKLNSPRL